MIRVLSALQVAVLTGLLAALTGTAFAATGEEGQPASRGALAAAPAEAPALTLQVSGLATVNGNLFIALYDSADTWLGEESVLLLKVAIEDHRNGDLVEVPIEVPAGEYAMTVFYDRDDNGELNTSFIGMPKEPIALSNNAAGKFGPPSYEDAVFEVGPEPVLQALHMEQL
ncbi:MAG: DUF2141 domain-containing protein [Halioglobus sp.]|nr:DUF2141 domain-containing protein [Halioglobus sp.]